MSGSYTIAFLGLWALLTLLFAQWFIASMVKARDPNAVPGKISQDLSHESFVFRAHRTFMNSLENTPLILGTFFLAIFAGVHALFTASCIWLIFVARVGHMLLYYKISTEKNPSPRSYFFGLGLLATLVLLTGTGVSLILGL